VLSDIDRNEVSTVCGAEPTECGWDIEDGVWVVFRLCDEEPVLSDGDAG
jgi:hypothetical protein